MLEQLVATDTYLVTRQKLEALQKLLPNDAFVDNVLDYVTTNFGITESQRNYLNKTIAKLSRKKEKKSQPGRYYRAWEDKSEPRSCEIGLCIDGLVLVRTNGAVIPEVYKCVCSVGDSRVESYPTYKAEAQKKEEMCDAKENAATKT